MRCLYSDVKWRRLATATTSGSGRGFESVPVLPSVALRSPSVLKMAFWNGNGVTSKSQTGSAGLQKCGFYMLRDARKPLTH